MTQKTKLKQTVIGLIPEDWEVEKLNELLFIKGRIGWKGLKKSEFGKDGIVIINGPDIKNGKVDWKNCLRVPKWRYDESQEISVKKNDILMTKDGTIGKTAQVKHLPEPATLASGIFLIRSESKKLDQNFLYQYFNSAFFKNLIESRTEGSVIPHLYQRDIEQLSIPFPSSTEQQSIAKILSDLDSKIELNQNMSKILEEIGRIILKHWFIDFEFPNEVGKPYKSSGGEMIYNQDLRKDVPKGWKIGTLGNFAELNPEVWSKNTAPPEINYVDLSNTKWGKIEKTQRYLWKDAPSRAQRILRLGDTIVGTVRPGNGSFSFIGEEGLTGSTGFAVLRPHKNIYEEFIYFTATSPDNISHLSHLADGAAYPAIRSEVVLATQTIMPKESVMEYFAIVTKPIMTKISDNYKESRTLIALHDLLLPKLMSGKIRVPVEAR